MTQDATPITIEKPSQLAGSPMSAVIGFDHRCCFCGYNLRSLALNGHCPECGADVNHAIRGSRMVYQSPDWINRLRLGAWLVFGGITGMILIVVAFTVLSFLPVFSSFSSGLDLVVWIQVVLFLAVTESLSIGMVMLSWSAPIQVRRKQLRAAITRTSGLCIAVSAPIFAVLAINAVYSMQPNPLTVVAGVITWVLILIGTPLLYFFGLAQLSSIASLIPWPKGQRRTLTLQIYAPVAFGLWLVGYTLFSMALTSTFMSSQSSGSSLDWFFMAMFPIVTLILILIGATMIAGLSLGLARRIGAVAAESALNHPSPSSADRVEKAVETEETFDPSRD